MHFGDTWLQPMHVCDEETWIRYPGATWASQVYLYPPKPQTMGDGQQGAWFSCLGLSPDSLPAPRVSPLMMGPPACLMHIQAQAFA